MGAGGLTYSAAQHLMSLALVSIPIALSAIVLWALFTQTIDLSGVCYTATVPTGKATSAPDVSHPVTNFLVCKTTPNVRTGDSSDWLDLSDATLQETATR